MALPGAAVPVTGISSRVVRLGRERSKSATAKSRDSRWVCPPAAVLAVSVWTPVRLATALKAAMTQATVDFACARLPELRDAIAHTYAATPLTYRHYTGAPHGAAYGLLKDWRSIMASHIPARTKFENLLLTGQNLTVHGAIGVTLSAAATCSEIVGTEYLAKKIANA